ncbi:MAG: hypothetical protein WBP13_05910 [Methylophilaceae bacterium]
MRKLFDNYIKKLAFLFVVISILTGLSSWKTIIFEPTDFSQLKTTEGEIHLGIIQLGSKGNRSSVPLYLVSENIKTQLHGLRGHQFNFETRKYLRGKHAKAWVDKDYLLYQLEVDGKKVISYEDKKTAYIRAKREDTISSLSFVFLSLFFFYLAQLAEPPIETKRN